MEELFIYKYKTSRSNGTSLSSRNSSLPRPFNTLAFVTSWIDAAVTLCFFIHKKERHYSLK